MDAGFVLGWQEKLLTGVSEGKTGGALFSGCARHHYDALGLSEVLAPYKGDLSGLITFLTREWGWIVTISADGKTLLADENKLECVCPVATAYFESGREAPRALCDCSAQFAQLLFSGAVGRPVAARVIRSVIRDRQSCIYEVKL